MMRRVLFFALLLLLSVNVVNGQTQKVLFLPLDERFTTRFIFLNMAELTPFEIVTPPMSEISQWRTPANLTFIDEWVVQNLPGASALVFSSELYLYGGLITSRCSNDSTTTILARLQTLMNIRKEYPNINIYVSNVIMRIPAYNEDFEEPIYWNTYGWDLYSFSYYLDKYYVTGNETDLEISKQYESMVPADIVQEFLWRRQRNHNVTMAMLENQALWSPFTQLFITQDDNAQYGLNIMEANQLRSYVASHNLNNTVHVYPGADEVGLTMLGKMSTDLSLLPARKFLLVYRNFTTKDYIPNYEGQPMNLTVKEQVQAAGGVIVETTLLDDNSHLLLDDNEYDVVFLINNFDTLYQVEAPNQPPPSTRSFDEYDTFIPFIEYAVKTGVVIAFADNMFSNGGDLLLVEWIMNITQPSNPLYLIDGLSSVTYAGWNTDGNTLGTVIANSIILSFFGNKERNTWFQMYRFLEDAQYQAVLRQELQDYVYQVITDNIDDLAVDLSFYERYVWKVLNSDLMEITSWYDLPYQLESIYYPWNRTFEIGMFIQ
eukprot:TRINITY_DN2005_c0_g3_i2.p1 TRINITY_DN2005_c0_g3~~TRINITY_DN2005_c0_g3_i2.p1  ORF type:complete len:545 (+),score=96.37 TRINITY_DN2005_c0_g3_i2:149-1783(+)